MENSPNKLLLGGTLILALVGSGCVPTTLGLASDHPARIDAPPGRVEAEPAAILRPNAPLYPSGELTLTTGEEGREIGQSDNRTPDGTRDAPFVGQGVIRAIAADQLQIQHGMIPGFMMAMTMTFPVAAEVRRESLEVGNEIVFRIERLPEERIQIFSIDLVASEGEDASGPTEP